MSKQCMFDIDISEDINKLNNPRMKLICIDTLTIIDL